MTLVLRLPTESALKILYLTFSTELTAQYAAPDDISSTDVTRGRIGNPVYWIFHRL